MKDGEIMKKIICVLIILGNLLLLASCNIVIKTKTDKVTDSFVTTSDKAEFEKRHKTNHNNFYKNGDELIFDEATSPAPTSSESDSGETSSTTLVVEGIDEADTIKNNDRYIFYANGYNLTIIDTNDDKASDYQFDNYIDGLYLKDDLLVVISSSYENGIFFSYRYSSTMNVYYYDLKELNAGKINLLNRYQFDNASYGDSRMIDGNLYLMYRNNLFENNKFINPTYSINKEKEEIPLDNIMIYDNADSYDNYAEAISLINQDNQVITKEFYGISCSLAAFKDNFYFYFVEWNWKNDYYGYSENSTHFLRMDITDNNMAIKGEISQKGTINNIFSVDEYEDTFRVVTTYTVENYHDYHNVMATYDVKDDNFSLLDSLEFASDESVYSVRFENEKAYVVTYLYIDPLFEFDLKDPKNIQILRELKSPGVSDYLDYINEDFILGIGRITIEHDGGDFQYATSGGIKLSLFSLDNEEMVEEYTYIYPYEYSYSGVLYNHHLLVKLENSLTYFMPLYGNGRQEYFDGVVGFQIDLDNRTIIDLGSVNTYGRFVVVASKLYLCSHDTVSAYETTLGMKLIKNIK